MRQSVRKTARERSREVQHLSFDEMRTRIDALALADLPNFNHFFSSITLSWVLKINSSSVLAELIG
jgi:hypothetical protein